MNRREEAELTMAITEFFAMIGDGAKDLLMRLPPGTLAAIIVVMAVFPLSAVIIRYLTKGFAPIELFNGSIKVPPWVFMSITVTAAIAVLIL